MGRGKIKSRVVSKRLWRPLLGIVVAYAVAAQSLLLAFGGFSRWLRLAILARRALNFASTTAKLRPDNRTAYRAIILAARIASSALRDRITSWLRHRLRCFIASIVNLSTSRG